MLSEMRPSELGMWRAKWRTSPWGEMRADIRSAFTSYGIHAAWLKKRSGDWSMKDFLPFSKKEEAPPQKPLAFLRGLVGKLVKKKES